ncbi:MAG: inorganic phosphate transporter [Dechloromonas sp.]|nr:MAG: inorganic phosphate transporter [Dechloromonas sp.]
MEIIAQHSTVFYVMAFAFGLCVCWGMGANNVANAMGTSVGSGAITLRRALLLAAVMEFAGAYLAGGEVAATVSKGIIDSRLFEPVPHLLLYGMIGALLAAGIWLMIASIRGWPVSATHAIVGAICGAGVAAFGVDAVNWETIAEIVVSWLVSPVLGAIVALLLTLSIRKLIFNTGNPIRQARRWGPLYAFLVGWIVALVTITTGLKYVNINLGGVQGQLLAIAIGVVLAILAKVLMGRIHLEESEDRIFHFASVEKLFVPLMVFTGAAMAFAHGSNDLANGVGPMATAIQIIETQAVSARSAVTPFMLLLGAIGIVVGVVTYGYKVMATIGNKITQLTPTRGYAATVAASIVVVVASGVGMPVSTTHIAVGAVIGVGIARGIGALDMRVIGGIILSWIITVPIAGVLAAMVFHILRAVFG